MNHPVKPPKSSSRKWLWISAIVLGGTLLVMITALLRFKADIAGAQRASPTTVEATPKAALPQEGGK
jgi:hypothetical protein